MPLFVLRAHSCQVFNNSRSGNNGSIGASNGRCADAHELRLIGASKMHLKLMPGDGFPARKRAIPREFVLLHRSPIEVLAAK